MRARKAGEAEAASHPFLAYHLAHHQKKSSFIPGAAGKVSDWSEDEFRRIRALYYGMISEVDSQLGRIWQGIRDAGAWDDTIVILTSDHAEMMGDHFMLGKGGWFDGSYHIPLVIKAPGSQGTAAASSSASPRPSTSCRRSSTSSAQHRSRISTGCR